MLIVTPNMNSCVEDILNFKTCCGLRMFDGNLEILVTNAGDRDVVVRSFFDLESEAGSKRINAVMPQGDHKLQPGVTMAFYTQMDETAWSRARSIVFYDADGNKYAAEIPHGCDSTGRMGHDTPSAG